jgi:hypothetical protein
MHCQKEGQAQQRLGSAAVNITAKCTLTNTGTMAGDEVVMVFHSAGDTIRKLAAAAVPPHPVPLRSLVAFERMGPILPAETVSVTFNFEFRG